MVFLISHVSVTDESAEGRDDEPSLQEVSSEVFSLARGSGEEDEGSREEEENQDEEDQGEEWSMHAHSSVSYQGLELRMLVS